MFFKYKIHHNEIHNIFFIESDGYFGTVVFCNTGLFFS